MKKTTAVLFAFFVFFMTMSADAQLSFTLRGKLTNPAAEGERIILSYQHEEQNISDTARVKAGGFIFKGVITQPSKATLNTTISSVREKQQFYIDSAIVIIEGETIATAVIKSGPTQSDFNKLNKLVKPIGELENKYSVERFRTPENKDSVAHHKIIALLEASRKNKDNLMSAFIYENPGSYISLEVLAEKTTVKNLAHNKDEIVNMFDHLHDTLKNTSIGKTIKTKLDFANKFAIGKPSIDFTMNDTLGRPVSLASFRGKYVLLDFWASWCMPCRFENPYLVKAYEEFRDKNFTILSVSLDRPSDKQAWINAIRSDQLNWTHISDLKFSDNEAAKLYGIYSIPMNYLIDPDGNIIAVYLRGEELSRFLKQIL